MTDADHPVGALYQAVDEPVAGLFPVDAADYQDLKDALGNSLLNDASVTWAGRPRPPFDERHGTAGLLYMEIIQELARARST